MAVVLRPQAHILHSYPHGPVVAQLKVLELVSGVVTVVDIICCCVSVEQHVQERPQVLLARPLQHSAQHA